MIHRPSYGARMLTLAAAVLFLLFSGPQHAAAVTAEQGTRNISYVIAYEPMFGMAIPFVGWLQGTVKNGIISGTYRGLSIQGNDPFVNRTTRVTGGVSGNNLHFTIGNGSSRLSFNGQYTGSAFEGSATWRGQIWRLAGQEGRPRGM